MTVQHARMNSLKAFPPVNLRAKQFTLAERPLREPGGRHRGGSSYKRAQYAGHCVTIVGSTHCSPHTPLAER